MSAIHHHRRVWLPTTVDTQRQIQAPRWLQAIGAAWTGRAQRRADHRAWMRDQRSTTQALLLESSVRSADIRRLRN